MRTDWSEYKLGDLGTFFGGVTSIKPQDYGYGTPFLPYKNVFKNSKVDVDELVLMNVKPQDIQKRSAIYGDIFFTASSETPDEVAMSSVLLDDVQNLTYNGFCKRFRLNDFQTLIPEFARYLFRSKAFRESVCQVATGDIRFNISQESLGNISVYLPSLAEQKRISRLLFALDDKIELNRRINDNLERQAQAIFKSWFVDFAPFRNGEFIESELGTIPKEWKFGSIYFLVNVIYGYPFKSALFRSNDGIGLIRIRDLKNNSTGFFTTEEADQKYLIQPGDVLAGMDAEFTASLWRGDSAWLNQRVCKFEPKFEYANELFVLYMVSPLLKKSEFGQVGTTVIHLGKTDIDKYKVIIPTRDVLKKADSIFAPIHKQMVCIEKENRNLSNLRDTLLPKLMSGKLSIAEVGTMI